MQQPIPRIDVAADVTSPGGPWVILTVSFSASHPAIQARRDRWQAEAAELTRRIRELPPAEAEAACQRLEAALTSTRAEIETAERNLAGTSERVAEIIAAGHDPAAVEAMAAETAATLQRLRSRLPALESQLVKARVDRNQQQTQAEAQARAEVAREAAASRAAAAAELLPGNVQSLLDRLAALQIASAMAGQR